MDHVLFPFDRVDKPADRAVKEVTAALRDLRPSTLLFLSNISMIACTMPDGDERLLQRRVVDGDIIEIESVHEGGLPSRWYRITGDVEVDGATFTAAAAFALKPSGTAGKGCAVEPVDGQVFIYFPAVKETSGLKFHIHAPFAFPVARDSVKEDPSNDELVAGIAELIVEALPGMRDAGLINDGLLSALPNEDDEVPEFYDVIRGWACKNFCV